MTLKDVADLLIAARERIDFYWNFYVIVVVALIGWMITVKKTLTVPIKSVVTVAFLIAASMNLVGLYSSYTFAEALRTDLLRLTETSPLVDTRLLLQQHSYLPGRAAAIGAHLAIGATIVFTVWYGRLIAPETGLAEGSGVHEQKQSR